MDKMFDRSPLEVAIQIADLLKTMKNPSLTAYQQPTTLSPIIFIDKKVMEMDQGMLRNLLQTHLSVYTALYLHAVNIAMNIDEVKAIRILDQFSTSPSLTTAAAYSPWLSNEAFEKNDKYYDLDQFSKEALDDTWGDDNDGNRKGTYTLDKSQQTIMTDGNLVVGKLIEIKFIHNNRTISIPVRAYLVPKVIDTSEIINMVTVTSKSTDWGDRYHAMKSGEIRVIKDWLLNMDLIEADRKALIMDKTKSLLNTRSDQTKGFLTALLRGKAPSNIISSMMIVSKSTANEMEMAMGGKLSSNSNRANFFSKNKLIMLSVVDTFMERFSLYQRDSQEIGQYTLEDIKYANSKPNTIDINELYKATKTQSVPSSLSL